MLYDKDIREPLFDFLEEKYGKIRIIEEKSMGRSRADIVMVTSNALIGVEIKSDADTYARLSRQVKDYDKYYDYNYVVVGSSHALHIREHIPDYWGVISVELVGEQFDFYILRNAVSNPKVSWQKKIEIMWRPELALIQEWNKMPKYKSMSKQFVKEKILDWLESGKIRENQLQEQICEILFERDYNNISATLLEYRKEEAQRKLEKERDPEQYEKLMFQRELAKKNFKIRTRRRRRK